MNWEIGGLPLHPLLVHLTTIAVPAATMAAIVVALWPRARKWLGVGAPIIAFVAMVSTPLSSSSGEWLEEKVRGSAALEDHVHLAKGLLPWVVALFVLLAVWWQAALGWSRPWLSVARRSCSLPRLALHFR